MSRSHDRRAITARRCSCRRPNSRCAQACRRRSRSSWSAGRSSGSTGGCARPARAAPKFVAARRPALRQRQHPHRSRAQQDPQGRGDAQPADARPRFQLRAGLGLPRPADRVEDRGGELPLQEQAEAEPLRPGGDDRVPPANAAPMREHWLNVQREEFKRLGVEGDWDHPYTTMGFPAEAQIARELMKFARERHALPRLQAGDVERGGEDRARRGRGRVRGLHERHGVGEVSGRERRSERRSKRRSRWRSIGEAPRSSSGPPRPGRCRATARSPSRRRSNTASTKSPTRAPDNWASSAIF